MATLSPIDKGLTFMTYPAGQIFSCRFDISDNDIFSLLFVIIFQLHFVMLFYVREPAVNRALDGSTYPGQKPVSFCHSKKYLVVKK